MIIWSINGLVNGDQFAKGSSWNGSVVGEKTENLFDDRRVLCVIVDELANFTGQFLEKSRVNRSS
jgi:hypothetical protein